MAISNSMSGGCVSKSDYIVKAFLKKEHPSGLAKDRKKSHENTEKIKNQLNWIFHSFFSFLLAVFHVFLL